MTQALRSADRRPNRYALGAGLLLLGAAGTVGTALFFEHALGYIPCALCLQERVPYYVSIGLALAALAAGGTGARPFVSRALVALIGFVMLWSLYLAVFHAGVEWHWWAGPTDCAVAGNADLTGDLLSTLDGVHPPACDRAAGRFAGLSFAGWNAVASAILAGIAFAAARRAPAKA